MKKKIIKVVQAVVLAWTPVGIGYLYNLLLAYVDLPQIATYIVAAVFLIFWFWAGQMFAKILRHPAAAILAGNSMVIVSTAIYYWQYAFTAPEQRNFALAVFSQNALAPVITISGKVGIFVGKLLRPGALVISQLEWNIIQGVGLALMLAFFSWGYLSRRGSKKPGGRVRFR